MTLPIPTPDLRFSNPPSEYNPLAGSLHGAKAQSRRTEFRDPPKTHSTKFAKTATPSLFRLETERAFSS
jgi:hypothetical protein